MANLAVKALIGGGVVLLSLAACQGDNRIRRVAPPAQPEPSAAQNAGVNVADDTAEPERAEALPEVETPTLPAADEVTARQILANRFRSAGFRILHDVPLATGSVDVTLDGYDPAHKVGFEYVATEERNTDLTRAEKTALAGQAEYKLLLLDATDAAAIGLAAERFLGGLSIKPNSGSGRR